MRTTFVLAIASFLTAIPAEAQLGRQMRSAPPEPGLECFAQMTMPAFPQEALREDVDGTVWTTISLTPQDAVGKIDAQVVSAYRDGTKLLEPAVEKAIRESTFKPECEGKTLHVAYRYQIDGVRVANPQPETKKEPPNVVWIESQPPLVAETPHHATSHAQR